MVTLLYNLEKYGFELLLSTILFVCLHLYVWMHSKKEYPFFFYARRKDRYRFYKPYNRHRFA